MPWKYILFLLALVAAVLFFWFSDARAQGPRCGPYDQFAATLSGERWGERRAGIGVLNGGATLELWINPQTGTFSILVVGPDGTACMPATGTDFEAETMADPAVLRGRPA